MAPSTFNLIGTVFKIDGVTPETGSISIVAQNAQEDGGDLISKGSVKAVLVGGVLKASDGTSTMTLAVSEIGYIATPTFNGVEGDPFFIPGDPGGGEFDIANAVPI